MQDKCIRVIEKRYIEIIEKYTNPLESLYHKRPG